MADIVILGAGVMGSAIAVPAARQASNRVVLVGSPLDDELIASVQQSRKHPTLNTHLPESIQALKLSELTAEQLANADIIIIGVSSPGIDWVINVLKQHKAVPTLLALVTKGLVENPIHDGPPQTYAEYFNRSLPALSDRLVGIGGPCIARELALEVPTRVTFAAQRIQLADELRALMQTDYYRITTHANLVAVEACAALKNFLCIGVSAMISAYPLDTGHAKNPVAALYNQAVLELLILSRWIDDSISGDAKRTTSDVAFDLAGMGDLHVTVGGGRNSRLGTYLGQERRLHDVLATDMQGVTVEGVDTGRRLLPGFNAACASGHLRRESLPLTASILQCIEHDEPFNFRFTDLPG